MSPVSQPFCTYYCRLAQHRERCATVASRSYKQNHHCSSGRIFGRVSPLLLFSRTKLPEAEVGNHSTVCSVCWCKQLAYEKPGDRNQGCFYCPPAKPNFFPGCRLWTDTGHRRPSRSRS